MICENWEWCSELNLKRPIASEGFMCDFNNLFLSVVRSFRDMSWFYIYLLICEWNSAFKTILWSLKTVSHYTLQVWKIFLEKFLRTKNTTKQPALIIWLPERRRLRNDPDVTRFSDDVWRTITIAMYMAV